MFNMKVKLSTLRLISIKNTESFCIDFDMKEAVSGTFKQKLCTSPILISLWSTWWTMHGSCLWFFKQLKLPMTESELIVYFQGCSRQPLYGMFRYHGKYLPMIHVSWFFVCTSKQLATQQNLHPPCLYQARAPPVLNHNFLLIFLWQQQSFQLCKTHSFYSEPCPPE